MFLLYGPVFIPSATFFVLPKIRGGGRGTKPGSRCKNKSGRFQVTVNPQGFRFSILLTSVLLVTGKIFVELGRLVVLPLSTGALLQYLLEY